MHHRSKLGLSRSSARQDEHANELQKLQVTKKQLMAVVKLSKSSTTAFDIIQQRSMMLKIVIIMGGFGTFKSKKAQRLYDIIFNVSFWTCGSVCALNLIYQKMPYHNLPTDMLTAYVHLPAWQSWLIWRRFVKTQGCAELLAKAQSNQDRAKKLNTILRFGGWLVLLVQCVMVPSPRFAFGRTRAWTSGARRAARRGGPLSAAPGPCRNAGPSCRGAAPRIDGRGPAPILGAASHPLESPSTLGRVVKPRIADPRCAHPFRCPTETTTRQVPWA